MMPWLPKKPCPVPGCPELIDGDRRRCKGHEVEYQRAGPSKASAHRRGYGRRWERLRRMVLRRDPMCQIREKCSGRAFSTEVDHIVPKARGGGDQLDNLQGACRPCHSWKTATGDGGFGR
jgi:5-methylcytosine-specific restriction enzyme A